MKKILLQLFIAFVATFTLSAHVTKVNYLLDYNCETNLYEVKLKVVEGSAATIPERAQFNAQITLVIPTGTDIEIVELVNPLQNNYEYMGTVPTEWALGTPGISPASIPQSDFYPIAPFLAPVSLYNDLSVNDEVVLFICKIGNSNEYNPAYRFYNNDTDMIQPIGFGGENYSNGFTLGSPLQIYNGNEYKSCTTSTKKEQLSSLIVYPNPFLDNIYVDLSEKAEIISITDNTGKVLYYSTIHEAGIVIINSSVFPSGTYMMRIQTENTHQVRRIVKL